MNATVDETLERVEQLYTAITGTRAPVTNDRRAAFPPEIDPIVHVEHQLERMIASVESLVPVPTPWSPRATMWREDEDIIIAVDVPGVPRENVRVQVEQNAVVVIGRRVAAWAAALASPPTATRRSERLLARSHSQHRSHPSSSVRDSTTAC